MRLGHIDALRGVAALAVLVGHIAELTTHHADFAWPLINTVNLGRFGVLLFFLISGFVVPFSLKGSIGDFAISRAARLLPALWLSIGAALLIKGPVDGLTLAANMTMTAWPFGIALEELYWTLTYELAFYVLCAGLYAAELLKRAWVIGALALAILAASFPIWQLRVFPFLLLGLLIRLFYEGDKRAGPWALAIGLAVNVVAFLPTATGDPFLPYWALVAAAMVPVPVFCLMVWWAPKVPNWMIYFGAISYSLYLFQAPVLHMTSEYLGDFPAAFIVATIAATIAVAATVFKFVETPCIALGKRLLRPKVAVDSSSSACEPAPLASLAGTIDRP